MYPAQALADGLYTINDLPDEIVVQKTGNPITLQRGIGSSEPPQIPGAFYGSSDPNGNEDYVFLYNGFWEYGPGVPVCSQAPCLITDLCAKDQFADTYTILDVESGQTIIVNRKSLCLWEEDNGGTRLFYNFGGPPPYNQYGAEIPRLIAWYIKDTPNLADDEGVSLPFSQQVGYGLGRLNTPVGNYGNSADDNPNSQIVYTVS
jgi:hypothetical protein